MLKCRLPDSAKKLATSRHGSEADVVDAIITVVTSMLRRYLRIILPVSKRERERGKERHE